MMQFSKVLRIFQQPGQNTEASWPRLRDDREDHARRGSVQAAVRTLSPFSITALCSRHSNLHAPK